MEETQVRATLIVRAFFNNQLKIKTLRPRVYFSL